MSTKSKLKNETIFNKIKVISNRPRFRILEITQSKERSISELSSILNLSYTKCADYVKLLENAKLIQKTRSGKEALIKSRVKFKDNEIKFI